MSSGYESLKPPLKALPIGLRTEERMTTSLGDFLRTSPAARLNILLQRSISRKSNQQILKRIKEWEYR